MAVPSEALVIDLETRQAAVANRLAAVRRQIRWHLCLEGIAWLALAASGFVFLSLLLDWTLRLGLATRLTLAAAAGLLLLALAYGKLVRPLAANLADLDLALVLDRLRPGVAQQVATVLQLPGLMAGQILASPAMVHAAVVGDAAALEQTDLAGALDRRRNRRCWAVLAGALLLPIGGAALAPAVARLWTQRWLLGSDVRWPQRTYLAVVGLGDDGRIRVPRGEPVVLQVEAEPALTAAAAGWSVPGRGAALVVAGSQPPAPQVPAEVQIVYRTEGSAEQRGMFERFGKSQFRYELAALQAPVRAMISGGDDWLGPITVEPIDRPAITEFMVRAKAPAQAQPQTFDVLGAGTQLLFLPRTELELHVASTLPLANASLLASTGAAPKVELVDERHAAARWTMKEAQTFEIQLSARDSGLSSRPYFLPIGLLKDREPRVTVRATGVGRRITPQARLPLSFQALDDFGLTKADWEFERTVQHDKELEKKTRTLPVDGPKADAAGSFGTEVQQQSTLPLRDDGLTPGSMLRVRGVAVDNCVLGKQTGYSRWLTFQVVTADELFYEILMRQRAERARFRTALDTARTQAETLAATKPEQAKAEQTAGWLRRHQLIARQVTQVGGRLDATLQEMTLNDLGSPQARELLESKIVAPLRQLPGEMLDRQRQTLEALAAGPVPTSARLGEARKQQQEIVTQMQRILEQMAQWESFVDVVNQLREVINLQSRLLDTTEKTRKERLKGVFDE